jgi:hypothetical protein
MLFELEALLHDNMIFDETRLDAAGDGTRDLHIYDVEASELEPFFNTLLDKVGTVLLVAA